MAEKLIRSWKKVNQSDLGYISYELKEIVEVPALIILEGPVGAGKTTFCKNFADNSDSTSSPTYSVVNEYLDILHADFYRLKSTEEIYHLELPLYLGSKNFVLVEWGEKYFDTIMDEIGEGFTPYLLKISLNKSPEEGQTETRDFNLYNKNSLI